MSDYPHNRFVILAAPRSGSNMLCSLLHSHKDILCHHELYNPADIFYALPLRNNSFQLAKSLTQRDKEPLVFLNHVWQNHLSHPCVGFKMTHRQNPRVFEALLADHSIKKIVLKRNNVIKVHVSKLIAEHNGIWEDYGEKDEHDHKKTKTVDVNWQDLNDDIAFNHAFYAEVNDLLTATKQPHCCVTYEALQEANCQKKLLDFLNVTQQPLKTVSVKQNPSDLSTVISNFDELLQQCPSDDFKAQLIDQSM